MENMYMVLIVSSIWYYQHQKRVTYKDYNPKPTRWRSIGPQYYSKIAIKYKFEDDEYNHFWFYNKIEINENIIQNVYGFQVNKRDPKFKRSIKREEFKASDNENGYSEFVYPERIQWKLLMYTQSSYFP